jgi:ureidoacrylate peracid hydrolase
MPQKFEIPEATRKRLMARQGRIHAFEWLDPKRTALLVVDMQNYFMAEGYLGYCPHGKSIVPNVNRLADALRAKGGMVVWIQMEASEESKSGWSNFHETYTPENRERRFTTLAAGTDGYALDPGLVVKPGDVTFVKRRYSAFTEAKGSLIDLLRSHDIQSALVCGVATNVCCESTARTAMMHGIRTIMVSDGNATNLDEDHQHALKNFMTFFGDVQSTDELVALIAKAVGSRAAAE